MPRRLPLDELVTLLVSEHAEIMKGLDTLDADLTRNDYPGAKATLERLDKLFRIHIEDEEAQILRVLINAYGVKGADEAIQVFRQHRPIYRLIEAVKKFSEMPPAELSASESELRALLREHTSAEENKIFPWALSTKPPETAGES